MTTNGNWGCKLPCPHAAEERLRERDLQTNTWNLFKMQIIGLHLGPMNHTLWAWGPVICDLRILPADSNACQSLRTSDLILSELSIPQQLL